MDESERRAVIERSRHRIRFLASSRLARFWHHCEPTYKLVRAFQDKGPTNDRIATISAGSFEDLIIFLRRKEVMVTTEALLRRVHHVSTLRHRAHTPSLGPQAVNVRVFLAGYMIAHKPSHVFESMGALEQSLSEVACQLLGTFQTIIDAVRDSPHRSFSSVPSELLLNFLVQLARYFESFKAWKVPDEAKLISRVKHALIGLYQAELSLPATEPLDSPVRVELKSQINRLRTKVQRIGGPAALEQLNRERLVGLAQEGGISAGVGIAGMLALGTPATQNTRAAGAVAIGLSSGGYFFRATRMSNGQLAHELLLNPRFQLAEPDSPMAENPILRSINRSFQFAFWNSLVDDLRLAQPCYARVLLVLTEICNGIRDLRGTRVSRDITEVVDLDLIRHQAERGLLSWQDCVRLITAIFDVIQQVQATERGAETLVKWTPVSLGMEEAPAEEQPRAFCTALEFLLERVNVMRIDAANVRLRLLAPVIKDHGVEYERHHFRAKLTNGLTLEKTEEWMFKVVSQEVASSGVDLEGLLGGSAPRFVHVHAAAVLAVVINPTEYRFPETLEFDEHRLGQFGVEFRYLSVASAMLINVAKVLVGVDGGMQVMNTVSEMFVGGAVREMNAEQATTDICKVLTDASLPQPSVEALRIALLQCATPSDAVNRLIVKRMRAVWLKLLVRPETTGLELQQLSVATTLLPHIKKTVDCLRVMTTLNRNVHVEHYNRIIAEAALRVRAGG